jgi:hypothetical protein
VNVPGNLENILIELFFSWLLTEFEASKLLFCNAKLRYQGHISLVDAAVDTALKRMQEAHHASLEELASVVRDGWNSACFLG